MTGAPRATSKRVLQREAKANIYFAVYCSLGVNRSLREVAAMCSGTGAKIAESTLFNYSTEYGWVERAAQWDRDRLAAVQHVRIEDAIANDAKHVSGARMLMELALAGAKVKMQVPEGSTDPPTPDLTGMEIARLFDVALKSERLVSGKATEIRHVIVEWYGLLITDIADLWSASLEANHRVYGDPSRRDAAHQAAAAVYGPGADRVLQNHLRAVGMQDLLIGGPEEGVTDE